MLLHSLCKGIKLHLQSHLSQEDYASVWKAVKNRIPDIEYTSPDFLVTGSEIDKERKTVFVWATLEPLKMQVQVFVDQTCNGVEVALKYAHSY